MRKNLDSKIQRNVSESEYLREECDIIYNLRGQIKKLFIRA